MTNNLVSVYIPTHNRAKLAIRAVKSVLNQTYKNIEVIVIDDGSLDDTYNLISEINDERLIVLKNEKPMGACFSRNLAINMAKGNYITGLDDDDYFSPDRIEKLYAEFDDAYAFIFDSSIQDNNGVCKKEPTCNRVISINDIFKANIGNQVFTLRRRIIDIGGFDESFPSSQDYDLWTRLLIQYKFAKQINSSTYYYDITHGGARISTSKKAIQGAEKYFNKYRNLMTEKDIAFQFIRMTYYGKVLSLKCLLHILIHQGPLSVIRCYLRAIYVRVL